MVVRFQCSCCSQPIEVDDEWASKPVVCPYCRKTVTAPTESTLKDVGHIPTAAAVDDTPGLSTAPSVPGVPSAEGPAHPNRVAVVAFILACSLPVMAFAFARLCAVHEPELVEIQERTEELLANGGSFLGATQRAWVEYLEAQGGNPPTWIITMMLLEFGGLATWLGTIICGIVGVCRPRRRPWAVAALVIAGFSTVFLCCGGLLGAGVG